MSNTGLTAESVAILRQTVEAAGGEWEGVQEAAFGIEPLVLFWPFVGSSHRMALPASQVSVERVKQKIEELTPHVVKIRPEIMSNFVYRLRELAQDIEDSIK
jgi:hypothetical protein